MDVWQGAPSPFQNLKWITLTFSPFLAKNPPNTYPPPHFYTARWKQPTSLMWPFPLCSMRTKEMHSLSMLLPSLSHSVSVYPFLSLQSLSLPFFYVSVLMIYFWKNGWPLALAESFKLQCLFKRDIHVNYFYLRQAPSEDKEGYLTVFVWLQ